MLFEVYQHHSHYIGSDTYIVSLQLNPHRFPIPNGKAIANTVCKLPNEYKRNNYYKFWVEAAECVNHTIENYDSITGLGSDDYKYKHVSLRLTYVDISIVNPPFKLNCTVDVLNSHIKYINFHMFEPSSYNIMHMFTFCDIKFIDDDRKEVHRESYEYIHNVSTWSLFSEYDERITDDATSYPPRYLSKSVIV